MRIIGVSNQRRTFVKVCMPVHAVSSSLFVVAGRCAFARVLGIWSPEFQPDRRRHEGEDLEHFLEFGEKEKISFARPKRI